MKKTKTEKGITLIALIITIVLLLILAVSAITAIRNEDIIGQAQNAAKTYNQAVANEQDMLERYENYLEGNWTQKKTTVTNGRVTLTVGQEVTGYDGYSGSYTGGWAVLGAENGKLLLVSKTNVQSSVGLKGINGDTINGYQAGYYNGIAYLNSLCSSYLNSTLAEEARSIKVEDINRVTGYNPETAGYGAGKPYQYGNTVTYTLNTEGKVVYTSDTATGSNASGTSRYTSFEHVDGRTLTTSNSIDVTSNYYYYYLGAIEISIDVYHVLFGGASSSHYWLASQWEGAYEGEAKFGMRQVDDSAVTCSVLWVSSLRQRRQPDWSTRGSCSKTWSQYNKCGSNFIRKIGNFGSIGIVYIGLSGLASDSLFFVLKSVYKFKKCIKVIDKKWNYI